MRDDLEINRRSFLKRSGLTALAGASSLGSVGAATANNTKPLAKIKGHIFDFDEPYNRIGTDCYKWDHQIERWGADKLRVGMGVATMDFRAAPCITEALNERCKHENWGYPVIQDSFYKAITDWNRERHGLEIDPESLVVSAGVYPGIIAALRTLSEPASKVLLLSPAYSGFYFHIKHTNTVPNDSPMVFNGERYEIDWDDFESRLTPDTHAMVLCNPHNPTGNVWSEKDLLKLGRLCLENQIVVLADEIHCDLVRTGEKYIPFASLPDKAVVDNSITFKAVSKTFSLAGLKNAYFHSTNPVLLERVKNNHRPDINEMGLIATEAAYRHGGEWIDQLLPYLDENHRFLEDYVKKHIPLIKTTGAQGTYLSWLDVSELIDAIGAKKMALQNKMEPLTTEEYVEKWLMENAGVQLNPGTKYGTGGSGYMRMNLATSRKTIKIALDSLAEAMQKI